MSDHDRQMTSSHPDHYCDHEDAAGVQCMAMGQLWVRGEQRHHALVLQTPSAKGIPWPKAAMIKP